MKVLQKDFLKDHPTGIAYFRANSAREPKDVEEAEFVSHIDGDSVKLRINGKVETVQFLLVDTPETQHPEWGTQPLGEEASEYSKKILSEADRITLEYDVEKRDKYGRVLAYVYTNGQNAQEELLEKASPGGICLCVSPAFGSLPGSGAIRKGQ
ncbi:nuclease homologue [Planifilum fulgidum]|uniref:Nuclease homologue n=1 Tax=Planifilum fulgidum TaxID=201973 RepID=A0A1I2SBD9_9BACL|nr:thermonuclease family protein [Planifilum fulgidum]SFG49049.1 nuclease homologue [Planifilum fulgidum]